MQKNTGIVLNSLTISVITALNTAIMNSIRKAGKPSGCIGEVDVVVKAPFTNANFNDIPVIGLTDKSVNQTFAIVEGQKPIGCIVFSEVKYAFEKGALTILPVLCSAYYNTKTTAWNVNWAIVAIDKKTYKVNFNKDGNIIGGILINHLDESFDEVITKYSVNKNSDTQAA